MSKSVNVGHCDRDHRFSSGGLFRELHPRARGINGLGENFEGVQVRPSAPLPDERRALRLLGKMGADGVRDLGTGRVL